MNLSADIRDGLEGAHFDILLSTPWDKASTTLIKNARSGPSRGNLFVVDMFAIPNAAQLLNEELGTQIKLTRSPTFIYVRGTTINVVDNNEAIYRELGL